MKQSPRIKDETSHSSEQQGIQSVEVAAPLLLALANAPGPLALSALARNAGMPSAKAHRYLVSLIRVGLVEQDAATGLYDLGALALELGLAALGRLDAVKLADEAMTSLRDATGETVALATWGNFGPTYIRLLQSRGPVTVNLQIGSVMPLTYTASGLCFAAFMPESETRDMLDKELMRNRDEKLNAPSTMEALAPLLAETRQHGMARMIGHLDPSEVRRPSISRTAERLLAGFNAFSAPVFDHEARMRFCLTVVGSSAHIDGAWDGDIAQATKAHAQQLSQRLGYRAV
ncbi:IclR family transcriptional regulator [Noviherbaspirillum cavernae]|uniref:IclR family transcriptional regulator n=1 Tax=Noviherbaspirillum cavernae TaxID=2320862 RepID=A0A418WZI3_9BURK|nr:IclR family transcriptional regulator [Noviherbaspirillum cavernae]RJG05612.1 IclR family transcriptional regulator [Noviherbaspirillum cavernae]